MPKREDIKSILIIGAGPIVIGQACEFDYSGTQACKALRDEGYKVILVNSNPATIMTDPNFADATYVEPITPEMVAKIIEKERPDALLPTMGGQTALNCSLQLEEMGVLKKFGVQMIGADADVIDKAENRERFAQAMEKIGLEVPKNKVVNNLEDALEFQKEIGLPAIIRPSFTLGGSGGGVATTMEEFKAIVESGLEASPTTQVLIDESLLGWKEYEMEVVRDKNDNCIIICSIENVDPMGVHTGDSITVAPALTLTDKEYQKMRDASLAVLREIGVETGGSNVQFGVNPDDGRMVVIEMNPRVSRSSALASKATGFPIAKVAAKLAVGYTLDELQNDCTKVTPASFEPTIDYVVTKIPRFTFEKFPGSNVELTSSMKSVGEVMAIGANFKESFQKALRSMEIKINGLETPVLDGPLSEVLQKRMPNRPLYIAEAFREGLSVGDVHDLTGYDPWFLEQIFELVVDEIDLIENGLPDTKEALKYYKSQGFSDDRIGRLTGKLPSSVRTLRSKLGVHPVFKRVDTCAAEFASETPYFYSTYGGSLPEGEGLDKFTFDECQPTDKEKVVILGGGPNRIGQGIEFDYACVHACFSLSEAGYETIMVNCNPETVSTDFDTSDRLYFEPLTAEDTLEILHAEQKNGKLKGVNVQFGGQTPLKLAGILEANDIPLLGTDHDAIDLAEDRDRFKVLIEELGLKQPENYICSTPEEVKARAQDVGYPVVVRPSYVLGGRAMAIVYDEESLKDYLKEIEEFFEDGPILLDNFLQHAVEIDVDAIADGDEVYIAGVMEHIEEAGIHSGDSACSLPPYSLGKSIVDEIKEQTKKLAKALKVCGLMNIQFAVKDGEVYIIEVNPRASRTVPFVAKATGVPVAKIASRIMAGEKIKDFDEIQEARQLSHPNHVAVKEVVLPFARFPGADIILGPEMKSTGEVMGLDTSFDTAFAKAQIATGLSLPSEGTVFISVKDDDKTAIIPIAKRLVESGYKLVATKGTAKFLKDNDIEVEKVNKVLEGSPHIVDRMEEGGVQFVINTTAGSKSIKDSFSIRQTALQQRIPYSTSATGARELVKALEKLNDKDSLEVTSLQHYFAA